MNIYRKQFYSPCPNNGQIIDYRLEIQTDVMIQVEHINTAVAVMQSGSYHEDIADALFAMFGGQQSLKAHHHGVDVETLRE